MNRKAFTLAEIVVAVAIIGTVATLTIPTFFANSTFQKNQYVNALKKFYTELCYATEQIRADNGGTLSGKFVDKNANGKSHDEMANEYGKYLKYSKVCTLGAEEGVCWHAANKWYFLDGAPFNSGYPWYIRLILNDGTLMYFEEDDANVNTASCTATVNGSGAIYCGSITADINGFKGPNIIGRDIFRFFIRQDGVVNPSGDDNWYRNACTPGTNGNGCPAKVLKEGNMNY